MKRVLRHYIIDTFSLYFISNIAQGLSFGTATTIFIAGAAITLVSLIAKPIISLLLLPINLITFGLFRWVTSGIIIYLTTLIVPAFKVTGFYFTGFNSRFIDIPTINLHGIWAYIAFSFLLSTVTSFVYWLIK